MNDFVNTSNFKLLKRRKIYKEILNRSCSFIRNQTPDAEYKKVYLISMKENKQFLIKDNEINRTCILIDNISIYMFLEGRSRVFFISKENHNACLTVGRYNCFSNFWGYFYFLGRKQVSPVNIYPLAMLLWWLEKIENKLLQNRAVLL